MVAIDVGRIIAVTGIVLTCLGLFVGPRRMCVFAETKGDIAQATVKKFVYEAYPSWRQAHRYEPCPPSLDPLLEYLNNKDTVDPWGGHYEMLCSSEGRMMVVSPGEDGRIDTADDITSGWAGR